MIKGVFRWSLEEVTSAGCLLPEVVFVDRTHIKANVNRKKHVKKSIPIAAKRYQEQPDEGMKADRSAHGKKPLKKTATLMTITAVRTQTAGMTATTHPPRRRNIKLSSNPPTIRKAAFSTKASAKSVSHTRRTPSAKSRYALCENPPCSNRNSLSNSRKRSACSAISLCLLVYNKHQFFCVLSQVAFRHSPPSRQTLSQLATLELNRCSSLPYSSAQSLCRVNLARVSILHNEIHIFS